MPVTPQTILRGRFFPPHMNQYTHQTTLRTFSHSPLDPSQFQSGQQDHHTIWASFPTQGWLSKYLCHARLEVHWKVHMWQMPLFLTSTNTVLHVQPWEKSCGLVKRELLQLELRKLCAKLSATAIGLLHSPCCPPRPDVQTPPLDGPLWLHSPRGCKN